MDSMVNHYTVNKKRRHDDAYTPGGKGGARPNHAAVVYSNLIRRTFKETPIILGGIEASLRRLAHYDYWSDSLKRSILLDSGADLISYGMGERSIVEIADALAAGLSVSDLTFIDGTVFRTRSLEHVIDYEMLPRWEEVSGRQACLRGELRRPVPRERPGDGRPFGGSVPPRRVRGAEPAGCAAYPKRDGRRLPPALCAHVASFLRRGRRCAGAGRGEVLAHFLPRLLRRVRLLRAHLPSGAHRHGPLPRVAARGGPRHDPRRRLQGAISTMWAVPRPTSAGRPAPSSAREAPAQTAAVWARSPARR